MTRIHSQNVKLSAELLSVKISIFWWDARTFGEKNHRNFEIFAPKVRAMLRKQFYAENFTFWLWMRVILFRPGGIHSIQNGYKSSKSPKIKKKMYVDKWRIWENSNSKLKKLISSFGQFEKGNNFWKTTVLFSTNQVC